MRNSALRANPVRLTLATGVLVAMLAGCSSGEAHEPLTLENNWFFSDDGGYNGIGLTVRGNGYVFLRFSQTGPASANVEIERGTIEVTASSFTLTPEEWTCQEPTDPGATASYAIDGNTLQLAFPSGIVLMKLNTTPASSAEDGLVLTNGCFLNNGAFVRSPLTPIGSCAEAGGDCASAGSTCCNSYACTNGGTCAAICTANEQCNSGCCLGAIGTTRVCASASACK